MAARKRGTRRASKSTRRSRPARRTRPKTRSSSVTGKRAAVGLSPYGFGHALGIVSAIALLFYAVMIWFGSFDSSLITSKYPLSFSFSNWTLLIGLIQTYVLSYIGGWIFAKVYNRTSS